MQITNNVAEVRLYDRLIKEARPGAGIRYAGNVGVMKNDAGPFSSFSLLKGY